MRVSKPNILISALFAAIALAGCGKGSGSGSSSSYYQYPGGGIGGGGCVPISSQIPFAVQGAYFDWANIVAGQVPMSGANAGQVITGAGGMGGYGQQFMGQGSDGAIQMNLTPGAYANMPYAGYPNQSMFGPQNGYPYSGSYAPYGYGGVSQGNNLVSGTGVLQLSSLVIQDILYKVQTGQIQIGLANNGYPIQPQQICVSAIAMNVGHYYNLVYGGQVYLYLNGTAHGYVMQF